MPALTERRIADLLQPYVGGLELPGNLYAGVAVYLDLLLRWNTRTNLTAIRDPEQLVQRQAGESLLAARFVAEGAAVLDFGSGAGFPGIPIQLAKPLASVTLAESQGKKASFLREAVRALGIHSAVCAGRVEDLPADQQFAVVTMRAVDDSDRMLQVAASRVTPGGALLRYLARDAAQDLPGWRVEEEIAIPLTSGRLIRQVRS